MNEYYNQDVRVKEQDSSAGKKIKIWLRQAANTIFFIQISVQDFFF